MWREGGTIGPTAMLSWHGTCSGLWSGSLVSLNLVAVAPDHCVAPYTSPVISLGLDAKLTLRHGSLSEWPDSASDDLWGPRCPCTMHDCPSALAVVAARKVHTKLPGFREVQFGPWQHALLSAAYVVLMTSCGLQGTRIPVLWQLWLPGRCTQSCRASQSSTRRARP